MDPKTRLLAIRLMENLRKSAYAQTLGVQVTFGRDPPEGLGSHPDPAAAEGLTAG